MIRHIASPAPVETPIGARVLRAMADEFERAWPAEGCGLIFACSSGELRWLAIPNIADAGDAQPSVARTQRETYEMDPRALLPALRAAEREGGRLIAIAHSHVDGEAYFSAADRAMALADGDLPLWPGVDYLVVSCRAGKVEAARVYRWNSGMGDFAECDPMDLSSCND